jgi:hypothetical protein
MTYVYLDPPGGTTTDRPDAIVIKHADGTETRFVPAADRDHYKARAEALLALLKRCEPHVQQVYSYTTGEPSLGPEIDALLTRINQEDSERA